MENKERPMPVKCSVHADKTNSLKTKVELLVPESDGGCCKSGLYLHNSRCYFCAAAIQSKKHPVDANNKFFVSLRSPCYACPEAKNSNLCSYVSCGACYEQKILSFN